MEIILLYAVERLLESLNASELAKALRTLDLLEEFGQNLNMPHSRHMSDGLYELRIRGKREVRIFYCFHAGKAHLLYGFIKKSEKTPPSELTRARKAKDSLI